MSSRTSLFLIVGLIFLRGVMAGLLPLSADEAYYWLWSRHLAAGYFDHPPAIAFLIRAGTSIFGDNSFGVRASGILLSLPATWFVWQSARALLADEDRARLAALLFNLMLMMAAELMAATPDMPSIVTSAAFLFCLTKVQADSRWWLAAGVAAGLSLLSKYSALFLGAGTLAWLVIGPRQQAWLKTPWPWAGAALAGLVFLPNLLWQADHGWMTFAFQFGRVSTGSLTGKYLLEFLGAQLGLATPFIFLLAILGLARAFDDRRDPRFLLAALVAPALIYFLIHAAHDRVQGNWPSFLYPVLAILAADAFSAAQAPNWRVWCSRAAMPVAALMLLLAYAQALYGVLPLKRDPVARLLGAGFPALAQKLAAQAQNGTVLTSDYETTAWLRFYQPGLAVIQVNEPYRYLWAQPAKPQGRLFYLVEEKRDQNRLIQDIADLGAATSVGAFYLLYPVGPLKKAIPGRMP